MPSNVSEAAHQIRALLGRASQVLRPGQPEPSQAARQRWLVVTIQATPEEIAPAGELPPPLAAWRDSAEVELRTAPGGRGTELAARPKPSSGPAPVEPGDQEADDTRQQLRAALRQVKQLVEVGEVLVAGPRPEGYRPRTLGGLLVDRTENASDKGGVL
jgi:hypothetical protein